MDYSMQEKIGQRVNNLTDAVVFIDIPDGQVYAVYCFVLSLVGEPRWFVDMRFEFVFLLSGTTPNQHFRPSTPRETPEFQLLVSTRDYGKQTQ
jgi:hypothetical protein